MNNPESLSEPHPNSLADQWFAAFPEGSTNSASEFDVPSNQDVKYEQLMADIERQDAEYEATLAEFREQEEIDALEDARFDFANVDFEFDNMGVSPLMNLNYMVELVGVYADIIKNPSSRSVLLLPMPNIDNPDLSLTDGGVGSKFALTEYIHSPEHAEAEYASYEEPLYDAFRYYLPEASGLLDQQISPDE